MKQTIHEKDSSWEGSMRELLDAQETFTARCVDIIGRCLPETDAAMLRKEFDRMKDIKASILGRHEHDVLNGGGMSRRIEDRIMQRLLKDKGKSIATQSYDAFIQMVSSLLKPVWQEMTMLYRKAPFWEDEVRYGRLLTGFYRTQSLASAKSLCFVLNTPQGVTIFAMKDKGISAQHSELGERLFYSQLALDALYHEFSSLMGGKNHATIVKDLFLQEIVPVSEEEVHVTLQQVLHTYPLLKYGVAAPIGAMANKLKEHQGIMVVNRIDSDLSYTHTEIYLSLNDQNILCWSEDYQIFYHYSVSEEKWITMDGYHPFIATHDFLQKVTQLNDHQYQAAERH